MRHAVSHRVSRMVVLQHTYISLHKATGGRHRTPPTTHLSISITTSDTDGLIQEGPSAAYLPRLARSEGRKRPSVVAFSARRPYRVARAAQRSAPRDRRRSNPCRIDSALPWLPRFLDSCRCLRSPSAPAPAYIVVTPPNRRADQVLTPAKPLPDDGGHASKALVRSHAIGWPGLRRWRQLYGHC